MLADLGLYVASMTASDKFSDPASVAQLTATTTAGGKLKTAMDSPNSDGKSANVQIARDAVDYQLDKLKNIVLSKANDPTTPDDVRLSIAAESGMPYLIRGGRGKQVFTVLHGSTSGSVHVIMPGGANSYSVVYTKDVITFKDRSDPVDTTLSRINIEGLDKDTKYAFFYKGVYPKIKSDWEGPITLTVL